MNLTYHDEPSLEWNDCEMDAYWNENGAVEITSEAELELLVATQSMHYMCLEAVDKVVKDPRLLRLFRIPSDLWPAMRKSWGYLTDDFGSYSDQHGREMSNKQFDFLGRFDWSWDGKNPPKLLEYNADTPSLLLESSAVSNDWL